MELVAHVSLLAIKHGIYTVYVFKNLETNDYIMCTKLPNWKVQDISIGDCGFLKYQQVVAGEEYFNPITTTKEVYNYSNIYFVNFIQKQEIINTNIIL